MPREKGWPEKPRAEDRKRRSSLYLAACFFLPITLLLPFPAHGEAVISVTPTRIPLSLAAGESTVTEVTLMNRGGDELRLLPQVLAVKETEKGELYFEKEEACNWVTFEQGELLLKPTTERQVEVTVALPAGAAPGMRRLALTFIQAPEGAGDIGVTGGLAVLMELDIQPSTNAASPSFPIWLPVLSVMVFLLATGALLVLQSHRKRSAAREAPADRGGGGGP